MKKLLCKLTRSVCCEGDIKVLQRLKDRRRREREASIRNFVQEAVADFNQVIKQDLGVGSPIALRSVSIQERH